MKISTATEWSDPKEIPPLANTWLLLEVSALKETGLEGHWFVIAYWSDRLKTFIGEGGTAVEEMSDVVGYHVITDSSGKYQSVFFQVEVGNTLS